MSKPIIEIENIGKCYRIGGKKEQYLSLRDEMVNWLSPAKRRERAAKEAFWALKNVSFSVEKGEAVGIIGRNGAGKSTILKVLSQITPPTEGKITMRGRVASLLEVGTGFHPELSGRENVYLNGAILGMSRGEIARKFDEIVDFAEVEQFLDTPVKRYSSGMYVRLAFAVAAHLEPEVLVVDEVLAVGDAAFQKKCLAKMGDVAHSGHTVLFVSHNIAAVRELCTKGVCLSSGIVEIQGPIESVIDGYLSSLEQRTLDNLETRKERAGAGRVRLKQVSITDREGRDLKALFSGDFAAFHFQLTDKVSNLSCTFTIYNQNGLPICAFESSLVSPEDKLCEEDGFTCIINEMPLLPGRYRLNVEIRGDNGLEDHVDGAFVFDVESGYLRGRRVISNSYSVIAVPHQWTCPIG